MRPNSSVQKKCSWCGALYDECDMMFGVSRCPECFYGEKFIYVDRQGKPMPDYKPHSNGNGDADYRNDKDDGCKIALLWFGRPVTCHTECPFKPDCLEYLSVSRRAMITKLLNKRDQIEKAYRLYDLHEPIRAIAREVKAPRSTIDNWIKRRSDYEPVIRHGDISGILVGVR